MLEDLAPFAVYVRFTVTLMAVLDPFLAVPVFLTLTAGRAEATRTALARGVAIMVFAVLATSALLGDTILTTIGASLAAFRVGGGLVLLLMALSMLNAQAGGVRQSPDEAEEVEQGELSGIVPLAIPLLAGPGSISTTIIHAEAGGTAHLVALLVCILIVSFFTWVVLRAAGLIVARLGTTGLNIATRLLGLLLAALAVQTMAEGLRSLFPGLA